MLKSKELRARRKRAPQIRKVEKVKPRLSVFRSNKQIYAQVIDDRDGRTSPRVELWRRTCAPSSRRRRQHRCGGRGRQADRRARARPAASPKWCSTAAATDITAGSRRWPMPRAKPACSFRLKGRLMARGSEDRRSDREESN